jgi:hypothetical protein
MKLFELAFIVSTASALSWSLFFVKKASELYSTGPAK